jgi:hypothetical protein
MKRIRPMFQLSLPLSTMLGVVSLDHIAGGHGGTWEDDGN